MSKIFFCAFFLLFTSTVAFIVAILTPFWIIKTNNPWNRGIFEVCDRYNNDLTNVDQRSCAYIFIYSTNSFILQYRTDYSIGCAYRSIVAATIGIILIWISGIHMCVKGKINQHQTIRLRTCEFLIAGTLLTVWAVMLVKNLDSSSSITSLMGWSLWLAIGSSGGFLLAFLLFCIHRIILGRAFKRQNSPITNSIEYLQRF